MIRERLGFAGGNGAGTLRASAFYLSEVHPNSRVRSLDRIIFTVLLAVVVHFLIWAALSVQPRSVPDKPQSSTLLVTLSVIPSERPDAAQLLAEQNQQASGIGELEQEPQRPVDRLAGAVSVAQSAPVEQAAAKPSAIERPSAIEKPPVIEAQPAIDKPSATVEPQPLLDTVDAIADAVPTETISNAQALLARSLEIARLEAEQNALAEQYAKRPRVRTLSTLTATASDDAFYLRQWQEKIERVGNLNYPETVRRQKLSGRLRVLVAVLPDGQVKEVVILKSSGYPELDQAALKIVRLSAPFAPFPRSIRERTDVLEIIRTWQFGNGNLFSEAG